MGYLVEATKRWLGGQGRLFTTPDALPVVLTFVDDHGKGQSHHMCARDPKSTARHIIDVLQWFNAVEATLVTVGFFPGPDEDDPDDQIVIMRPAVDHHYGMRGQHILLCHADDSSATMWAAKLLSVEDQAVTVGEWYELDETNGVFLDLLRLGIG